MPIAPIFASINRWWLRFGVLIVIGFPIFTGWPIEDLARRYVAFFGGDSGIDFEGHYISVFSAWAIYAIALWTVIYVNVGHRRFWEYMTAAFVLALTTVLLGALMRKAVPWISGQVSPDLINFKIAKIFIIILSTVPFTLMAINLFSAKNIIDRARSRYSGKKEIPEFYLHLCLALRMFQHVGEVVTRLFDVWTEEHPQLLIPRNRRQWGVNWYSPANFFPWAVEAVSSWIFACLMVTFAPLPAFVRELKVMQHAPDTGVPNELR